MTTYIGPNARVTGSARVDGSARVGGHGRVTDSARVTGSARVDDYAWVADSACVKDDAQVSGSAWVTGSALVTGSAQVSGSAWVGGSARVGGYGDVAACRHVLTVGPVGSENRTVTIHRCRPIDGAWTHQVVAGCWSGTVDQLAARIAGTPPEWEDSEDAARWRSDYEAVIALARPRIAEWDAEPVTPADEARWAEVSA